MITVKICGITQRAQAEMIADLGVDFLGFIVVPNTPRYVPPDCLPPLVENLPKSVKTVCVFRNQSVGEVTSVINTCRLDAIQLHGQESLGFCQQIRELFPHKLLIKAIAVRGVSDLQLAQTYAKVIDVLLLDNGSGGTGKPIDWSLLTNFHSPCPWWLAGGLSPSNVKDAITQTKPNGIDLSSGVEDAPGIKNIAKIAELLSVIR
ncbi:MAG: phosphoribosylanthranilate isomerase [Pseudanabaenaceae cyanobacterium SKYGB_i_bin29]|nr:phosphoribosylanthranilate isomerase [Pseudanabaenaceae cyanobacterium SKYG29]MDW8421477.1 phosphoribosylanthranilate isomerase [Pseudanabaenaceae cyanobacterium SKYGB_i_bin29]